MLVLLPTRSPNRPQIGSQGRVWDSALLAGVLWFREGRKLLLKLALHRFLDGADCVKQIAVAHQAFFCFYLRGFRVDQSLLFQLPNVLGNRVGTHAGILADPPDTGPALMGFPVLAEHQVGIDRQLAGAESQGEDLVGQKKTSFQWAPIRVSVFEFRRSTSEMIFTNSIPMFESMSIEKRNFTVYSQAYSCKCFPNLFLRSPFLCLLSRNF